MSSNYYCKKCGNSRLFEEVNVFKTTVDQTGENITSDEFFYRENVICLECEATLEDNEIIE